MQDVIQEHPVDGLIRQIAGFAAMKGVKIGKLEPFASFFNRLQCQGVNIDSIDLTEGVYNSRCCHGETSWPAAEIENLHACCDAGPF